MNPGARQLFLIKKGYTLPLRHIFLTHFLYGVLIRVTPKHIMSIMRKLQMLDFFTPV